MNAHKQTIIVAFFLIFTTLSCEKRKGADEPVACFEVSVTTAKVNEVIHFTNCSENSTQYSWDFGDNTTTSSDENPFHKYSDPGEYIIKLTCFNNSKVDTESKTILIESASNNGNVDNTLPQITTKQATHVTYNSATIPVLLVNNSTYIISDKGICWSNNSNPDLTGFTTSAGNGNGSYELGINNLLPETNYYVRAYYITNGQTYYGNEISFITLQENQAPPENINLFPYTPYESDWEDAVIVSKNESEFTNTIAFQSSDDLYISVAFINEGNKVVESQGVKVHIYVDNSLVFNISNAYEIDPDQYYMMFNNELSALSSGVHDIRMEIDPLNTIAEQNEDDNMYYKPFYIAAPDFAPGSDLQTYIPMAGDIFLYDWSDVVIISNKEDDFVEDELLYDNEELFVSYAIVNFGTFDTYFNFHTRIYVDGQLYIENEYEEPLTAGYFYAYYNWPIGKFSEGIHTVSYFIDAYNAEYEENEQNNVFQKTFTVKHSGVTKQKSKSQVVLSKGSHSKAMKARIN